jgi:hypothetical protein
MSLATYAGRVDGMTVQILLLEIKKLLHALHALCEPGLPHLNLHAHASMYGNRLLHAKKQIKSGCMFISGGFPARHGL